MTIEPKDGPLFARLTLWANRLRLDPSALPRAEALAAFQAQGDPCRGGVESRHLAAWEQRHGFRLPRGLRAWLEISNGFYCGGPMIHPLAAIGPMIPFARVPDLVVQPESWFELGNPGEETVCVDLGYTWPGGDCPIFTSGDDQRQSPPRLIAPSFEAWFLRLLHEGGREYWFDADFVPLGDPWTEHRLRTPIPPLPDWLRPLAPRVLPWMVPGADDHGIAAQLGISRGDVETLFRHLQHTPAVAVRS